MDNNDTNGSGVLSYIVTEGPGFLYGFILGLASGVASNWVWDKVKPKRKEPHVTLDISGSEVSFTGLLNDGNSEEVAKLFNTINKAQEKKKKKKNIYTIPDNAQSTK